MRSRNITVPVSRKVIPNSTASWGLETADSDENNCYRQPQNTFSPGSIRCSAPSSHIALIQLLHTSLSLLSSFALPLSVELSTLVKRRSIVLCRRPKATWLPILWEARSIGLRTVFRIVDLFFVPWFESFSHFFRCFFKCKITIYNLTAIDGPSVKHKCWD
jgi:hypothetical protein